MRKPKKAEVSINDEPAVLLLIRQTRKALNLSQEDLAEMVGVEQSAISKLERLGTNSVSIALVKRALGALKIDPNTIS
jgi:transcriptional regulator with XRE-family HTH domain